MCLEAEGRSDDADAALRGEVKEARRRDWTAMFSYLAAIRLELRVRRFEQIDSDDEELAELYGALQASFHSAEPSWFWIEQASRSVVSALAAAGRLDDAASIARRFIDAAKAQGHQHLLAVGLILRANVAASMAQPDAVKSSLIEALFLTGPNRVLRPYIDLAPRLASTLVTIMADGRAPETTDHVRRLLRSLDTVAPISVPNWASLSERERDILSALSAHATTKAIARTLGLSPETVKHHLKRIFSKLGVHSREEALRRVGNLSG
jgi:DNA-binding CsgD family transcriptional regulator